jgi:hypothetical protein
MQARSPWSLAVTAVLATQAGTCGARGKADIEIAVAPKIPGVSVPPASSSAKISSEIASPFTVMPAGAHGLRVLSPSFLELWLVAAKPAGGPINQWDFNGAGGASGEPGLKLPEASAFRVSVDGSAVAVAALGFKRRALYAPLGRRDLRVLASISLKLSSPIPEGAAVRVTSSDTSLLRPDQRFEAIAAADRPSPAIHVNQIGYLPAGPKRAIIGHYLGSLGELPVPEPRRFRLVDGKTGREVFAGRLAERREIGWRPPDAPYGEVFGADFSAFKEPGEYRVEVPGLGASLPFRIDEGVAAALARTYALGLYHQRCGAENALPFTRFVHPPCHTQPAVIPTPALQKVDERLARMTSDAVKNPKHTAPPLSDVRSALYPFTRAGSVDVSGGHHDAGDYGKYTINSAAFIHSLVFAADAFEGSASLDNLGLPESGDGTSDLLQIAKREADFLLKMQDADGGFYFLVQPRDRSYEGDALPERGDPQVVFPKNTSATAAAVAALAQASSSPRIKRAFPIDAERYLKAARAGYRFLTAALSARSGAGAYQKITHYGDAFLHDDEIVWARTELYLATGDEAIHRELLASFDPASTETRRWSWERLADGYGGAIRSYAFARRTGRAASLDQAHLSKCEGEIRAAAADLIAYAAGSAYGTSFPFASKRHRTAGWYFPVASAFDLAVARALDQKNSSPEIFAAMISNIDFEAGSNPNNIVFLTGLGRRRPREIVHQYAANDRRAAPPSGIPVGSIQPGPPYLDPYKRELGEVSFPPDGAEIAFPIYDRWGDLWNVKTEHVAAVQARALAALSALMASTPLKEQPYQSLPALIEPAPGGVILRLSSPGPDLGAARVLWESGERAPSFGPALAPGLDTAREQWIEAEAEWPDGRRAFAIWERGSKR